MIEKIYQRQMSAIGKFNFIKMKDLQKFCEMAQNDKSIEDEYFRISTGWKTEEEHRIVSKNLADFIHKTIK